MLSLIIISTCSLNKHVWKAYSGRRWRSRGAKEGDKEGEKQK
jgi:hypothetical protein